MEKNDSFILYQRYQTQLEALDMEQRGKLLTAIFAFNGTGTVPDIDDGMVRIAFAFIAEQLGHDKVKYERKCHKNAENAAKRWGGSQSNDNAKVCERINSNANVCEAMPNDAKRCLSDSDSESDSDSDSLLREKGGTGGTDGCAAAPARAPKKKKPTDSEKAKRKYGSYENVPLSEEQYEKLSSEIPDLERYIEQMSGYLAANGKKYRDYSAAIRNWYSRDLERSAAAPPGGAHAGFGKNDAPSNIFLEMLHEEAEK